MTSRPDLHLSTPAPPSSTGATGDGSPTASPRSTSVSLQATATLNAGLQRIEPMRRSSSSSLPRSRQSPSAGRRRSQVLMGLQIADPAMPAPGEMVADHSPQMPNRESLQHFISTSPMLSPSATRDLHHNRTPSLGELHQELENEQEFQVNRLLQEIQRLQQQLHRQQSQSAIVEEDGTATLPSSSVSNVAAASNSIGLQGQKGQQQQGQQQAPPGSSGPRSPGVYPPHPPHPRSSFEMARADLQRRSRTPSRGASPGLRAASISGAESNDAWLLGGRDESAFYQAETQMLVRENQMLRHRIRDLERQLSEASGTASIASVTHEPPSASRLHRSTSISDEEARPISLTAAGMSAASLPTVMDAPKDE